MKKIIIGIIVFILLLSLAIAGYLYFIPHKTISEEGLSFSYPKELKIDGGIIQPSNSYIQYYIENSKIIGLNRSFISVYIPRKNSQSKKILADYIEPEFRSLVKPITLNGHKGETVTYHLDRQLPGDRPVQAEITTTYLLSDYLNTPVMITYYRYDVDNSLDEAWKIFLKTLKY